MYWHRKKKTEAGQPLPVLAASIPPVFFAFSARTQFGSSASLFLSCFRSAGCGLPGFPPARPAAENHPLSFIPAPKGCTAPSDKQAGGYCSPGSMGQQNTGGPAFTSSGSSWAQVPLKGAPGRIKSFVLNNRGKRRFAAFPRRGWIPSPPRHIRPGLPGPRRTQSPDPWQPPPPVR